MASFKEQLAASRAAHNAASTIEREMRDQISTIFNEWDLGHHTKQTVRYRLEAVIRNSYRASAAVAVQQTINASGIPGWKPQGEVFKTEYLDSLLKDVRKNLAAFKSSDKEDADRRRAVLRIQHSAGVGAQRGYTDALISSYAELADFGYKLKKVWLANFINNTPCPICRSLHGTIVELHETFPVPDGSGKVYLDLQGPPRHPRCQCWITILIYTLENVLEPLDIDNPSDKPQEEMDTDDVASLPLAIFSGILKALRALVKFVTGI